MITIRAIREDEIAPLSAITVAAYRTLAVDVGDYMVTLADVAGRVRHARVIVAVDGDRLLGGVTYVPDAASAYAEFADADGAGIRMLAVDSAARGRGAGEALVGACVAMARADGRRRVVLHTTEAMQAAQRLYAKLGFERASERDWSPKPDIKLLGYELLLGEA